MSHRLDGVRLKLSRASVHLESLKSQVDGFLNSNPYGVVADLDRQTGKCILRAKIHSSPPPEWGAIIGDIAHNLRFALDQLVWQLALLQTATPYDRLAFPITTTRNNYRSTEGRLRLTQCLTARQTALVKWFQPYRRGDKAKTALLWLLQDINNTDKHRVIQTVGSVFDIQGLGIGNMWGFDLINMNVYGGTRLEDGTPVADFILVQRRPDAYMDMHPNVVANVEFGEGSDDVEGMPLIPTLSDIVARVERVVASFERFFSSRSRKTLPSTTDAKGISPFTIAKTVIGNLTRSLNSYLCNGGSRRQVVLAT